MGNSRAYHRPISIRVEAITPLPQVRDLPSETEMTVNLKLNQHMARELALYLLKEILVDEPIDFIALTIIGTS